jgi:hypothetical protein
MNSTLRPLLVSLAVGSFVLAPLARAQEDPLSDPDLQKMLKEAQELQKEGGPAKPVKMSDLQKQAAAIQEEQRQEELKEKAALQKQLAAPGPVALPGWTPATPQFQASGPVSKKIVDDEVRVIQTGTSPLSPKELGDAWEAGVAGKEINNSRNNITVNGAPSVVLYLSTRTDPRQEVEMEAKREAGGKITEVNISSPLPKPEAASD